MSRLPGAGNQPWLRRGRGRGCGCGPAHIGRHFQHRMHHEESPWIAHADCIAVLRPVQLVIRRQQRVTLNAVTPAIMAWSSPRLIIRAVPAFATPEEIDDAPRVTPVTSPASFADPE